jgi:membrane protein implicated in regulation of membrane protease activity
MSTTSLFTWWNAIYTLPLAVVLVFLAITSIVSLLGGAFGELTGDAHADHDVDVDADADVDHDLDLDHDGHVDAVEQAIGVAKGIAPADGHGALVSGLVFLGVGRAPLMMVVQVLLLLWGVIGWSLHQTFSAQGPLALAWSIPTTLIMSVAGTRAFASLFGRFFRPHESRSVRRDQLVGRSARVVFAVTTDAGTIHARDQHGTLHRVRARVREGRLEPGREVVITGYDATQALYEVADPSVFLRPTTKVASERDERNSQAVTVSNAPRSG